MFDIEKNAKEILELTNELLIIKSQTNNINKQTQILENDFKNKKITNIELKNKLNSILNNQSKENWLNSTKSNITSILSQIKYKNSQISNIFQKPIAITKPKEKTQITPQPEKTSVKTNKRLITPINPSFYIDPENFKEYTKKLKTKSEKVEESEEYTIYKSNFYARLSNQYLENFTFNFTTKHPDFFNRLYISLRLSGIKMLSKTYISVMFFTTIISLPFIFLISFLLTFNVFLSLIITIFGSVSTFFLIYYYPSSMINQRKRKIKSDLVFAIVHMSAIAGSGAKPIKIFKLLVQSKEYKELGVELKKIINYTNLFGYNLSTALRAVSSSTPSYEFKELLNGMIATIETGGDLKAYLKDKSEDTLIAYKLDQQKRLSILSTYSDLYTGILIAAPLLFIVTLAIIEKIAPTFAGISISLIATVGTYLVIPIINIAFIIFLNLTQPEI